MNGIFIACSAFLGKKTQQVLGQNELLHCEMIQGKMSGRLEIAA